jgi:hypothetical protein
MSRGATPSSSGGAPTRFTQHVASPAWAAPATFQPFEETKRSASGRHDRYVLAGAYTCGTGLKTPASSTLMTASRWGWSPAWARAALFVARPDRVAGTLLAPWVSADATIVVSSGGI